MKPLVFKCKIKDKQRLDMSWLSKIKTSGLSNIKNLQVNYGTKKYKLSTLFDISGNNFKDIIISNSNKHLDNIGNNLEDKKITIFELKATDNNRLYWSAPALIPWLN